MYKILVLLLLPLTLNATVTYKELPPYKDSISDLNAQFYFDFRSWEEVQQDPKISVQQYRKYVGTRCAGLYDYLTEREKLKLRLTVSKKLDLMIKVLNNKKEAESHESCMNCAYQRERKRIEK